MVFLDKIAQQWETNRDTSDELDDADERRHRRQVARARVPIARKHTGKTVTWFTNNNNNWQLI